MTNAETEGSDDAGFALSQRWWVASPGDQRSIDKAQGILAELLREIAPRHFCYGKLEEVVAFFEASDDVLVRLTGGEFAIAHPTWSGKRERDPWPGVYVLGPREAVASEVATWEEGW